MAKCDRFASTGGILSQFSIFVFGISFIRFKIDYTAIQITSSHGKRNSRAHV